MLFLHQAPEIPEMFLKDVVIGEIFELDAQVGKDCEYEYYTRVVPSITHGVRIESPNAGFYVFGLHDSVVRLMDPDVKIRIKDAKLVISG